MWGQPSPSANAGGASMFWQILSFGRDLPMSTMNISLPDALKDFVDEQVTQRGYGTSSEYVRELIRRDQDRQRLRNLLLAGAESAPATPADGAYFESLRNRVRKPRG
ncbi:putative addiction module antidote protein [compost metagenome]